ncbi:MAG TPA: OmpA family protein, partial [Chitinophagales bacterium]|nr:OmpA family protein [Chitinophagales bacterium]
FLLALLTPLILFAGAQDSKLKNVEKYPKVKWRKKLKIARAKIKEGSFYNAAQYLEDAFKAKPEKIDIAHLLGEVNRELRDYEAAEKYYKIVIAKDPEAFVNDQFHLGRMQKMNGHYADAKTTLEGYVKAPLGKKDISYKNLAKIEIEGVDSALVLTKFPTKIKVEKTEGQVNSTIQDFAPKPLKGGGVMFTSQQTDTAVNISTSKAEYHTSIFTAEKSGKSFTGRTELLSPPNDPKTNTGNAVLSPDGNTIVFTKCNNVENSENRVNCRLFRSVKSGSTWGESEELKKLNGELGTTTHPAYGVDKDGNTILYFASNRAGSKGIDIWYAKVDKDGNFGAATNAGNEVNTPGDDITPFYDLKNKLLYYSSDGLPSIGGLDVFKIQGTPGAWTSKPVNAGVPINSQADDLYFALDEKAARGFEVSNRIGTTSPRGATCCDDIWTVIVQRDITLKGIYVKRGDPTNTPVTGVDASLYKVAGNNFEFVGNAITTATPFLFPVKRSTSYKINGNKEGYWPSIDNLTIEEEEERDTIEKIFYLDPIIRIHIKIPNVYFAFDKSNVIDFYKGQIDSVVQVLTAHPGYSLEIQGHTDSKGTDEYNEALSLRRANEVKTFLIKKKKIEESRIVVKTFGEKQPAVPNELPTGEDDPEGRARNRRVEFKLIPDKPEDAPEIENYGEVVKQVKTGPGFTYGKKKK